MLKSLFLNETVFEFNIPTHIQAQWGCECLKLYDFGLKASKHADHHRIKTKFNSTLGYRLLLFRETHKQEERDQREDRKKKSSWVSLLKAAPFKQNKTCIY